MEFTSFDARGYPIVDVRTGYAGWAATYEDTVEDTMDLALLDRLRTPAWSSVRRAADLGCGTGRTGSWLRERGVAAIDGADITPEMLDAARARGAHDRLVDADATATGFDSGRYDLVIASLIDEHLPDLAPLYREARRLAAPGALFAIVGFHPHFIMTSGMPTHYTDDTGRSVAIATHVHLVSEHVRAARENGWRLVEMEEGVVDEAWLERKPKWERFRNHPVSFAHVWELG
ncbi:class I SAM-dependent methyltransferase [Saccharopolyspora sp. HNM0983]|uniref:Class I SAM-dependent methyltransferase n=1 Tax=Saccharopolyspora montiporae TaxID=2781240 RepID=A0A929G1E7_9PSEU|nr:class I SAM-dependent methyltransferase [Saccharopolyspora sp. HNM0983]MBE9374603.1 class I SAM-dependent methyltransferase [Saccharopolyspora sp. HNM0983]